MFVVQASRLPKAAETAAPQLLSNLRLSWNKALATSHLFRNSLPSSIQSDYNTNDGRLSILFD